MTTIGSKCQIFITSIKALTRLIQFIIPLPLGSPGPTRAQVAELVDALASGASDRKVMEVRVFSWAPLSPVGIDDTLS